jgi:hypothetical protein
LGKRRQKEGQEEESEEVKKEEGKSRRECTVDL